MTRIIAIVVIVAAVAVGVWYFFLRGDDAAAVDVEGLRSAAQSLNDTELEGGVLLTAGNFAPGDNAFSYVAVLTEAAEGSEVPDAAVSAISGVVCGNEMLKTAVGAGSSVGLTFRTAGGEDLGEAVISECAE